MRRPPGYLEAVHPLFTDDIFEYCLVLGKLSLSSPKRNNVRCSGNSFLWTDICSPALLLGSEDCELYLSSPIRIRRLRQLLAELADFRIYASSAWTHGGQCAPQHVQRASTTHFF